MNGKAVEGGTAVAATGATAGERFARALAAKDAGSLCALLADPVDFQALTPGRHWQASTGRQAVEEIILTRWFGAGDDITELCSVTSGRVLDREHVAYRVRVRRSGRDYLVEQQAMPRSVPSDKTPSSSDRRMLARAGWLMRRI